MSDTADAADRREARPPAGWASATLAALIERSTRPLLVGPDASSLRDSLGAPGAVALDGVPPPGEVGALAQETGADVVVLADVLAWVADERAYLAALRGALPPEQLLVVTAPNVTWLPNRVRLLEGRSPFGSGPVEGRPLRFFARGTLVESLRDGGYGSVSVRAVREVAEPATVLEAGLVDRLRDLADADVCGFVAVASPRTAADQVAAMVRSGSPVDPGSVAALTASLRHDEEVWAQRLAEVEAARAGAERELARLAAEREAAVAARDAATDELARVRARRGYRLLLRLERVARRVPFARAAGRRLLGRKADEAPQERG